MSSRQKERRIRRGLQRFREDRRGVLGEIEEESGTDSEEEDLNGGAAACAAARIEEIDAELWEMQNGMADLMVERRGLVRVVQDEVNEAAALERQDEQGDSEGESDGLEAEMVIVENLQD
jgi:hypothetical protein